VIALRRLESEVPAVTVEYPLLKKASQRVEYLVLSANQFPAALPCAITARRAVTAGLKPFHLRSIQGPKGPCSLRTCRVFAKAYFLYP